MRILACDPKHRYFFIGVTQQELDEQIIPLHESILEEYSHDQWPHILVTSQKLRDKEIAAQKEIKANPFTRGTRLYSVYIHEAPTFDAYIVVKPDLSELYFVPFDHFVPEKWGTSGEWHEFDKIDIKTIAELVDIPFTHKGGIAYKMKWSYTKGQAAELLDDLMESIPEWKKKGPKKVFRMVMAHYQAYELYVEEVAALLYKGGVKMPLEWWDQDQMHLKTQADYFEEKEEPYHGTRNQEAEDAFIQVLEADGRSQTEIGDQLMFDYLDGIIGWETFYGYYSGYPIYDELNKKTDSERREFLWINRYNPDGCPF